LLATLDLPVAEVPYTSVEGVRAIIALRFTLTAVLMLAFGYRLFRRFEREDLFAGLRLGSFMFLAYAFQTAGLQYTTP